MMRLLNTVERSLSAEPTTSSGYIEHIAYLGVGSHGLVLDGLGKLLMYWRELGSAIIMVSINPTSAVSGVLRSCERLDNSDHHSRELCGKNTNRTLVISA